MRPPARLRSQELRRGTPTPSVESVLQSKASDGRERAALVGLFNPPRSPSRQVDPEHSLDELAGLAAAAGAAVVLRVLQDRPRPDPATFLGSDRGERGILIGTLVVAATAATDRFVLRPQRGAEHLCDLPVVLGRGVLDRGDLVTLGPQS